MFAASLITFEDIMPLALFGMFAAMAWWALEFMATGKPRSLERLEEIRNPRLRRTAQGEAILKKSDTVANFLEMTSALVKPLTPKSEAEQGKVKTRLANAGFRSDGASAATRHPALNNSPDAVATTRGPLRSCQNPATMMPKVSANSEYR